MDSCTVTTHVWPWLTPWWSFWADFTSLFDWKALAAIGTAAAVMTALRRDSETRKQEILRERALLLALSGAIFPVVGITGQLKNLFGEISPNGADLDTAKIGAELAVFKRTGVLRFAAQSISEASATDFSDAVTITQLFIVKAAVNTFQTEIDAAHQRTMSVKSEVEALSESISYFERQADTLHRRAYPITAWLRERLRGTRRVVSLTHAASAAAARR